MVLIDNKFLNTTRVMQLFCRMYASKCKLGVFHSRLFDFRAIFRLSCDLCLCELCQSGVRAFKSWKF